MSREPLRFYLKLIILIFCFITVLGQPQRVQALSPAPTITKSPSIIDRIIGAVASVTAKVTINLPGLPIAKPTLSPLPANTITQPSNVTVQGGTIPMEVAGGNANGSLPHPNIVTPTVDPAKVNFPDLVISDLTLEQQTNKPVITITNTGNGIARAKAGLFGIPQAVILSVTWFNSTGQTIGQVQTYTLANFPRNGLEKYASLPIFTATSGSPAGASKVSVTVDTTNVIDEMHEANNTRDLMLGMGDLTISDLTLEQQTNKPIVTIANIGSGPVRSGFTSSIMGGIPTAPVVSVTWLNGAGNQVGTTYSKPLNMGSGLEAGASLPLITANVTPAPGAVKVIVRVDPTNLVAESNEGNNSKEIDLSAGDLTISDLTLEQQTNKPIVTIANIGSGPVRSGFTSSIMGGIPTAPVVSVTWLNGAGNQVGTTYSKPLNMGSGLEAGASLPLITANVTPAPGAVKVIVRVDPTNLVAESNEGNNSKEIDLSAGDLTISDLTLEQQTNKPIVTIANIGSGPVRSGFTSSIMGGIPTAPVVSVTWLNGAGNQVGTTYSKPLNMGSGLEAGASLPLITANVTPAPGAVKVIVRVDPTNLVAESNEGNNSKEIDLSAGDLTISDLTLEQQTNKPIVTIANIGSGPVRSGFTSSIMGGIPTAPVVSVTWLNGAGNQVGTTYSKPLNMGSGLEAGASLPLITANVTPAPGAVKVIVRVDPTNLVAESNEGNNSKEISLVPIPTINPHVTLTVGNPFRASGTAEFVTPAVNIPASKAAVMVSPSPSPTPTPAAADLVVDTVIFNPKNYLPEITIQRFGDAAIQGKIIEITLQWQDDQGHILATETLQTSSPAPKQNVTVRGKTIPPAAATHMVVSVNSTNRTVALPKLSGTGGDNAKNDLKKVVGTIAKNNQLPIEPPKVMGVFDPAPCTVGAALNDVGRGITTALTFNTEKKIQLQEEITNEKMIEAQNLLTGNQKVSSVCAQNFLKGYIGDVHKMDTLVTQPGEAKTTLVKIVPHQAVIGAILDKVEAKDQPEIKKLRDESVQTVVNLAGKMGDATAAAQVIDAAMPTVGSPLAILTKLETLTAIAETAPAITKVEIQAATGNEVLELKNALEVLPANQAKTVADYIAAAPGEVPNTIKVLDEVKRKGLTDTANDTITQSQTKIIKEFDRTLADAAGVNKQAPATLLQNVTDGSVEDLRVLKLLENGASNSVKPVLEPIKKTALTEYSQDLAQLDSEDKETLHDQIQTDYADVTQVEVLQDLKTKLDDQNDQFVQTVESDMAQNLQAQVAKAKQGDVDAKSHVEAFLGTTPEDLQVLADFTKDANGTLKDYLWHEQFADVQQQRSYWDQGDAQDFQDTINQDEDIQSLADKYAPDYESWDSGESATGTDAVPTEAPTCPDTYDPVCGDDGYTYDNECQAVTEYEVKIAYKGECKATENQDTTADEKNGEPVPTEAPTCPDTYDPVCGTDGYTYDNECQATNDYQVKVAYKGECKEAEDQDTNDDQSE